MAVVPFKEHKKADEATAWDGAAASKRVLEWSGGPDKDKVDWGKYEQAFAWVDSANKENLGSFKLPHSDVIDGDICDVWRGVAAAMAALLGGRGGTDIPEGDRKGAYNHLKQHYAQWEKEAPEFRAFDDAQDEIHALSSVRASLTGTVSDPEKIAAALEVINRRFAHRVLTPDEVYLLPPAEMSNQNLDCYFTRMAESSLKNYHQDALVGLPLMKSHKTHGLFSELPIGQSYDALLEQGADNIRLVVNYYMLRGARVNADNTDDLIRGIEAGINRAVSIGWDGGWLKCGLCGKRLDVFWGMIITSEDEDGCQHVPGVKYADGQTAFAWVEDAHMVEGSLVYAGATPEAILRKARWAVATGRLGHGEAAVLEDRWGVRIRPGRRFPVTGYPLSRDDKDGQLPVKQKGEGEGVDMTGDEIRAVVAERAPELVDRLAAAEDPVGALLDAWVEARESRAAQDGQAQAERAGTLARIAELESAAADGKAYRDELITRAVESRVRAQGGAFDAEAYRAVLAGQPISYVRSEIEAWEKTVREVLQPGRPVGDLIGRKTLQEERKPQSEPGRPSEAYKA